MVQRRATFLRFYYQNKEAVGLALASLWAHKMRALLTILGVVIGVTTVIAMVSVIDGLNATFASQLGFLGADTFFVQKYKAVQFGPRREEPRPGFTREDAAEIMRRCPAVSVADIYAEAFVIATLGHEKTSYIQVGGTNTERFDEIFSWWVGEGRMLSAEDIAAGRYVTVVGSKVADALAPGGDLVGRDIKLNGYRYRVVGVFAPKGEIFGQSMDAYALVPYGAFRKTFQAERDLYDSTSLTIKAATPDRVKVAMDQVEALLRERRRVPPEKENNFEIYTADSLISIFKQITGAAFAVMIGIAAVSLLVGGIGIMNIMLVSVTERTREIGIRKALGARRRDIMTQFVVEATAISVAGGVIGIVLGVILGEGVNVGTRVLHAAHLPVPWLPAAIKAWSIIIGVIFSVGVGLFFGIYPATKAAKLNPIEALRYE
jgi:putative ABC transport system permease protein